MSLQVRTIEKDNPSLVFDNYQMELEVNNEIQKFELWDTAGKFRYLESWLVGQEEYEQLRPLSYPDTDIFLICYSIADRISFNNVEKWKKEQAISETQKYRPDLFKNYLESQKLD